MVVSELRARKIVSKSVAPISDHFFLCSDKQADKRKKKNNLFPRFKKQTQKKRNKQTSQARISHFLFGGKKVLGVL